jgi:hypothetical protein
MSFIKLDRKIIDSEVFAHDGHLRFWLWLLLRANYKKSFAAINTGSGKKTVEIGRGQLLFGRNSAGSELRINSSTLYKWLKHFEKLGMIESKSNKHFTVVTICKYDEYQSEEMDEVTSREQASNKPVTNQCPTSNTSKEVKEIKENINTVTPPFDFKQALLNSGANEQHVIDFMAARKKKRLANTLSAFDLFQKEATKLNKTIPEAVEFCAGRSWGGLRSEYVEKETAQTGLNYLSGQSESDLINQINAITDPFQLDVALSKFQYNDQFTVLYHTDLQKFISWDTMVKCPKIGKVARKIFTAKSIDNLLTPATYGQRNKTA